MGNIKDTNQVVQITLDKRLVEAVDGILEALNSQLKEGEKKYTRSMLIADAIQMLFAYGAELRFKVKKTKGEKKDA